MKRLSTCWLLLALFISTTDLVGQQSYELATALKNDRISAWNRNISAFESAAGAIEMDAARGDGLAVLNGIEWTEGTIRLELLGENNPGRSFIGFAFNIVDQETYEAVYFRPFNFVAEEQIRKEHMVQYICHPEYTWSKLREERTGEFENAIPDPPDPDDWFTVVIKVTDGKVEVFMGETGAPVLSVDRLTETSSGKIGMWTGNGSSGRYRNLVVSGN